MTKTQAEELARCIHALIVAEIVSWEKGYIGTYASRREAVDACHADLVDAIMGGDE